MARPSFASVDAYLAAQPAAVQKALERVRAVLRRALPGASERISYQIPVYEIDGTMVLYFAGYPRHYAVYPATEQLLEALGDEAAGLLHGKATLRFPVDQPVPARLITRIAKLRAAEAAELAVSRAARKKPASRKKAAKKAVAKKAAGKRAGRKKR
jgi:uncharacterized protein YdhG (YjbR/CyaY superfamily)